MSTRNRIEFIKEMITEEEENLEALPLEGGKASKSDPVRAKALKFLNALEVVMSKTVFDKNMSKAAFDIQHILKFENFKSTWFIRKKLNGINSLDCTKFLVL